MTVLSCPKCGKEYQRGGTYYERHISSCTGKQVKGPLVKKASKATRDNVKIEGRINLLEKQVRFLMSKVDKLEVLLAKWRSSDLSIGDKNSSYIKNIIISKVNPRESISIDEILGIENLQKYSKTAIEKVIIDLIDDEVFDGSEGRSNQKILGNIGRLIRR